MTTDRLVVAAAVALVVCGGVARFVNLERHWYFHDEATTSLYLSGFTSHDFERAASERTSTAGELRRFQEAGSTGGALTAIRNEARGNPQHPPLFYAAARIWAAVFGSSIASLRALSALLGLLTLPCVYWLGRELFERSGPAWLSVGLTAVSPFEVLYSQEAREYTLWAATTALACAALLYALRRRTPRAWALYALCLVLALYTFPLSALVLAAHVVYVAARARFSVKAFAVAAAAGVVAWIPWILVATRNRSAFRAGTDWTNESISFAALAKAWLIALAANIVDKKGNSGLTSVVALLLGVAVGTQLVALGFVVVRGSRRAGVFLALLFAASFVSLALVDLAHGGVRSTVPRFIVPAYLALTLGLAALVDRGLRGTTVARVGSVALAAVAIACAVGSYAREASARVWWNQDDGAAPENRAVADFLNRRSHVFLLATGGGALLELSNYLRPGTHVRLVLDGMPPPRPAGTDEVFAYGSPATAAAAGRLRRLLSALRADGVEVRVVPLEPPCCGADIRRLPDQFWRVRAG